MNATILRRPCVALALLLLGTGISVPAGGVFSDATGNGPRCVGMVGRMQSGVFKQSGCGVAISPNWVIGVSHVGGDTFMQDGKSYAIEQKIVQPVVDGVQGDLALFKLSKPVPTYAEVLLRPFAGQNGLKGLHVYLAGYGNAAKRRDDGLGWQPIGGTNGKLRLAVNTIDAEQLSRYKVGSNGKEVSNPALVYDLDPPRGKPMSTTSGKYNTLGAGPAIGEGGVAGRDSGGGWFTFSGGHLKLIAVTASVSVAPGSKMPTPYCFGGLGFGIHLLPYKGWIYQVTGLGQFK